MSHLDYYRYQAVARGVKGPEDVVRIAEHHAFVYDRLLRPWLPQNAAARIVDLACGHGSFLYWLRKAGFSNLVGVDSAAEQVVHARSIGMRIEQEEVLGWLEAQPSRSVDVLFAVDFIEHISKDDLMRFLRASSAALADGGCLILRYPNGDSPFVGLNLFNDITHVWTYTTNALRALALMHGFAVVSFKDEGIEAIRDHRWLKVPIARWCERMTQWWLRILTRDRVIEHWNSNIWACLRK